MKNGRIREALDRFGKMLAEVAVLREPVSGIISLISGKNTGNFADSGASRGRV
jgi:hypothetical protein